MTTDGHDAYPRAIREELGETVLHRTHRYLNHWIEQDHRGINQRYGPRQRTRPSTRSSSPPEPAIVVLETAVLRARVCDDGFKQTGDVFSCMALLKPNGDVCVNATVWIECCPE